MSQHEDVFDLPKEDREPFDENGAYDPINDGWDEGWDDDDWTDVDELERQEQERWYQRELERLENEGGIGNQKT